MKGRKLTNRYAFASSASYVLDGSIGTSLAVTLTQDASLTVTNLSPGDVYAVEVTQDGVGGRSLTLGAGIDGSVTVDPAAGATTVLEFVAIDANSAALTASSASYLATGPFHATIVTASTFKSAGVRDPTPNEIGCVLTLDFTLVTDAAWRQFKIPSNYAGNAKAHVHWTKNVDTDQSGKAVKWRITYKFFPSSTTESADVAAGQQTAEVEDVYEDNGTTSRYVYRAADMTLTGAVAGYYLGIMIEAIAPAGAPIAGEPSLFSLDITFSQYVNQ